MRLIALHREVENGSNASPNDLAGTQLTAVFNLNQMLFWERLQVALEHSEYRHGRLCTFGTPSQIAYNGVLHLSVGTALVFLDQCSLNR